MTFQLQLPVHLQLCARASPDFQSQHHITVVAQQQDRMIRSMFRQTCLVQCTAPPVIRKHVLGSIGLIDNGGRLAEQRIVIRKRSLTRLPCYSNVVPRTRKYSRLLSRFNRAGHDIEEMHMYVSLLIQKAPHAYSSRPSLGQWRTVYEDCSERAR